jgi:hypothetical protein
MSGFIILFILGLLTLISYLVYKKYLQCKVSDWSDWSICIPTVGICGAGYQARSRIKTSGSVDCPSPIQQTQSCNVSCGTESDTNSTTPIPASSDCIYTWGACSMTCGGGIQYPVITSPATNGGLACPTEQDCNLQECPVDCQYTWGTCSATCGWGIQPLVITTPVAGLGLACPTANNQACNEGNCPVDCVYTWNSTCSATCGGGLSYPVITTPSSNGGTACPVSESCNTQVCPVVPGVMQYLNSIYSSGTSIDNSTLGQLTSAQCIAWVQANGGSTYVGISVQGGYAYPLYPGTNIVASTGYDMYMLEGSNYTSSVTGTLV